jgi:uncharacterized protein (TIGR03067 family)
MEALVMYALAVLLLCPAVPADVGKSDKADDAQRELARIEGVWAITTLESRGMQRPADGRVAAARNPFIIVGDRYVFGTHGGTVKIDRAKHTVDLTVTDGRYQGTTLLGLYEIKGGTLRIALATPRQAGERPKDFKTDTDSLHVVYTFEKDAKVTQKQAADRLKEQRDALVAQPGPGGFQPGGFGGRGAPAGSMQEMLRQIIERLDRIDKRLDAIEKRMPPPEKK